MKPTSSYLCAFWILSGCGGGNGELDELGSMEQALSVAQCRVTPGGGPPTQGTCTTQIVSLEEKTVIALANTSVQNPIFEWNIATIHSGISRGSGCGATDNSCEVRVTPDCQMWTDRKTIFFTVKVRSSNGGPAEVTSVTATVPTPICTDRPAPPPCVEPPLTIPALNISSEYCGGMHRTNWTSVAGATHYQVQSKPNGMDWNRVFEIYDYPGITVDIAGFQCSGDSYGDFRQRARACNACGCGPWGNEDYHSYFYGECR